MTLALSKMAIMEKFSDCMEGKQYFLLEKLKFNDWPEKWQAHTSESQLDLHNSSLSVFFIKDI